MATTITWLVSSLKIPLTWLNQSWVLKNLKKLYKWVEGRKSPSQFTTMSMATATTWLVSSLKIPLIWLNPSWVLKNLKKSYKWVEGYSVLYPMVFSYLCLLLEGGALAIEKSAEKAKLAESKFYLLLGALILSISTFALIANLAVHDFKASGASWAWCSPTKKTPWCYYPDGDAYNLRQEIVAFIISITQIIFTLKELMSVNKPKPPGCNCQDGFIFPLTFTMAECVVVTLTYCHCISTPKMFCEAANKYIQLNRMPKSGRKTFICPGCQLAKHSGGQCIMPDEFNKAKESCETKQSICNFPSLHCCLDIGDEDVEVPQPSRTHGVPPGLSTVQASQAVHTYSRLSLSTRSNSSSKLN